MSINGILVVNKPCGMTSHQVVSRIRRLANTKRVGHTGTLDPDVSGVLPVCIGNATRLSEYLLEQKKGYVGKVRFGWSTNTQDASGEIVERVTSSEVQELLTRDRVEQVLHSFLGEQMQTPPAFSAIKIGGKRSYDLARRGQEVSIPARRVYFYQIELMNWNPDCPYPEAVFHVLCSKGTYIRTLCHDVGALLSVPAHMAALTRTQSGPYLLNQAHTLEKIEQYAENEQLHKLVLPAATAVPFMKKLYASAEEVSDVENGKSLRIDANRLLNDSSSDADSPLVQVLDELDNLRAIYQITSDPQELTAFSIRPVKVFKE